jgi:hypothetical protein
VDASTGSVALARFALLDRLLGMIASLLVEEST